MNHRTLCVALSVSLIFGFAASASGQENVKVEDEIKAEVGNKKSQSTIMPINDEQTAKDLVRTPIPKSDDGKEVNRKVLPIANDDDHQPDNPLVIGADLVAQGGTHIILKNGVQLVVTGNIINNGAFSSVGGSNIYFCGSGNQSVSGINSFDTLTVSNAGTVTLNNPANLTGRLELMSGKLVLGSNTLTLGSSATVNGASELNNIITDGSGVVAHEIGGGESFMFPVAPNATSYNPLTIMLQAGDPTETFSVRVSTGVANPSGVDTSLCVQRTWDIVEQTSGGNHAKLAFQWRTEEDGSNFVPMFSSAFHYAGSRYYETDYLNTPNTPPVFVGTTITYGATSFSSFIIGQAGGLPVQLVTFTGVEIPNRGVQLNWRTLTEANNYGFFVQRKQAVDSLWADVPNSFVPGHGTTMEPHDYAFTDTTVRRGEHDYRLRQIDMNGPVHFSSAIRISIVTSVDEEVPKVFALHQNYPNPFNPTTIIRFALPKTTKVQLEIYNIIGQRVATLVDEIREAGNYREMFNATNLATGVYFYRLQASDYTATKRMLLVK